MEGQRITEDGNLRVIESGVIRITEAYERIVLSGSVAILANCVTSVIAGFKWNAQTKTPEIWNAQTKTPEIWNAQPKTPEIWTRK
jgi:hypothetical protein